MKTHDMENFISIIKFGSGMASYYVSGGGASYTAHLMKSNDDTQFPEYLIIDKQAASSNLNGSDPLTKKLLAAIKKAEADGDDIA